MRNLQKQKMGTKPIKKILPHYTYQFNELELELANTKPKCVFYPKLPRFIFILIMKLSKLIHFNYL